jgi:hypothetical protein
MSFCTIAGVAYEILTTSAEEGMPEAIGGVRIARNGGARNGVRGQRRNWTLPLAPLLEADFLTLYANTANSKFVTVNGDFLDGVATLCWVTITRAPYYKPHVASPLHRMPIVDIRECDPVLSVGAITPVEFILTSVDSPDSADPDVYLSTPDASYPGDASTTFRVLDALTDTELQDTGLYPICYSLVPERSWLSVELDNGFLSGRPWIRFETSQDPGPYTGSAIWRHQSTKAKLYLVRGGANIAGPWETNYQGVSLGGGEVTLTFNSVLALPLIAMDRFLIEFWGRLALQVGESDNGQRQLIAHGAVPGPRRPAVMGAYGNVTSL